MSEKKTYPLSPDESPIPVPPVDESWSQMQKQLDMHMPLPSWKDRFRLRKPERPAGIDSRIATGATRIGWQLIAGISLASVAVLTSLLLWHSDGRHTTTVHTPPSPPSSGIPKATAGPNIHPSPDGPNNHSYPVGPNNHPYPDAPNNHPSPIAPNNHPSPIAPNNHPYPDGPNNHPSPDGPDNHPSPIAAGSPTPPSGMGTITTTPISGTHTPASPPATASTPSSHTGAHRLKPGMGQGHQPQDRPAHSRPATGPDLTLSGKSGAGAGRHRNGQSSLTTPQTRANDLALNAPRPGSPLSDHGSSSSGLSAAPGSAPGESAPGSVPGNSAPGKSFPGKSAPGSVSGKLVQGKSDPGSSSSGLSTAPGSAPGESAPGSVPGNPAPGSVSGKLVQGKSDPGSSSSGLSAAPGSVPGESAPGNPTPGNPAPPGIPGLSNPARSNALRSPSGHSLPQRAATGHGPSSAYSIEADSSLHRLGKTAGAARSSISNKSKKTADSRQQDLLMSAGIGIGKDFATGGRTSPSYNVNGKSNLLSDYIPAPWFRYYIGNRIYLRAALHLYSPQYVRPRQIDSAYSTDTTNTIITATYSSTYLGKLYYTNIPLSIHYRVAGGLYLGAGIQFSKLFSGVGRQDLTVMRADSVAVDTTYVAAVTKISAGRYGYDRLRKIDWRVLFEVSYSWRRFTMGLQYQQGLTNYMRLTPQGTPGKDKNASFGCYLQYDLWQRQRKK